MVASAILVVEDDPDIRSALCALLEVSGYEVASAPDGSAALSQLQDGRRPSVILLDLAMPVMNGNDFREAQLSDPQLADIPVVVLSSDDRYRDTATALRASAAVGKPFELEDLLATIERVAGNHERALASAG
ncbi:MAG TPA: response regulator [Anaeromyxobacteraceae bacterium]|nr:response regulator [Anaeromyxobacteraceae bacterium]